VRNAGFILTDDKRIYVGELDTLLKSRGEKRSEPVELLVLSASCSPVKLMWWTTSSPPH
jgi:CHAT domain-containing protein